MPDEPAARCESIVSFPTVIQRMLKVMSAVDEDEIERCEASEVVGHGIGLDEEHLPGFAKVIGELTNSSRRHVDLLLGR